MKRILTLFFSLACVLVLFSRVSAVETSDGFDERTADKPNVVSEVVPDTSSLRLDALFTANGGTDITVHAGDWIYYAWSAVNADILFPTMVTIDAPSTECNQSGTYQWDAGYADSFNGTNSAVMNPCATGRTYTLSYKVGQRSTGAVTEAKVIVRVLAREIGPEPLPNPQPNPGLTSTPNPQPLPLLAPECSVNGLYGTYYNLPRNHPDIETTITGVVSGTTPFMKDWYSERYFSFSRTDAIDSLNVVRDYFPVQESLDGDPFYFAVHWKGFVSVPRAGIYMVTMGSDDDAWLYVNGTERVNIGGIHPFEERYVGVDLPQGTSSIDLYFAERHRVQSGFRFAMQGDGVKFSACDFIPPPPVDVNHAPVISLAPYATTTVGIPIEILLGISDQDNDLLTVSSTVPADATFSSSSSVLLWSPLAAGTSTATFVVSDGATSTTASILLEAFPSGATTTPPGSTSTVNLAPAFVNFVPPMNATETVVYEYQVQANDPEGDPIAFSLPVAPDGMTIASSTGFIEWTPTSGQATTTPYEVIVRIADLTHVATTSYGITVAFATSTSGGGGPSTSSGSSSSGGGGGGSGGGSNPPALGGPIVTVSAGGPIVTVAGGSNAGGGSSNQPPQFVNFAPPPTAIATALYYYDVDATDPENDKLVFSLIEAPAGMNIIPSTGFIYWIPSIQDVTSTSYLVTVQVSDGAHTTTTRYSIVVGAPEASVAPLQPNIGPPVIYLPSAGTLPGLRDTLLSSIETTTAETPPPKRNGFLALLLAGFSDYAGKVMQWIRTHVYSVVFIALLLALLAFAAQMLREKYYTKEKTSTEDVFHHEPDREESIPSIVPEQGGVILLQAEKEEKIM